MCRGTGTSGSHTPNFFRIRQSVPLTVHWPSPLDGLFLSVSSFLFSSFRIPASPKRAQTIPRADRLQIIRLIMNRIYFSFSFQFQNVLPVIRTAHIVICTIAENSLGMRYLYASVVPIMISTANNAASIKFILSLYFLFITVYPHTGGSFSLAEAILFSHYWSFVENFSKML